MHADRNKHRNAYMDKAIETNNHLTTQACTCSDIPDLAHGMATVEKG